MKLSCQLQVNSDGGMSDRPVLVVADSRGRLLGEELDGVFTHMDVQLIWKSGLRIRNTAEYITPFIRECKPKLIYILNGICDLFVPMGINIFDIFIFVISHADWGTDILCFFGKNGHYV